MVKTSDNSIAVDYPKDIKIVENKLIKNEKARRLSKRNIR